MTKLFIVSFCQRLWSHRTGVRFHHPNWQKHRSFYATLLLGVATANVSPAQIYETLATLDGTNGGIPSAGLVQGLDGNLYSTTPFGGTNLFGVVYKVSPATNPAQTNKIIVLHAFTGPPLDGAFPAGGLLQTKDGTFYGTTMGGGASGAKQQNNCTPRFGCGAIFRMNSTGRLKTLHSFCLQQDCPDGAYPESVLLQSSDGDFYGTTAKFVPDNIGTVFKFNSGTGTLTTLYSFCPQLNCPEGANPEYGLVQAADGNFYGTTENGGTDGLGVVFKITPEGKLTVLHSFEGAPFDGADVLTGLVLGRDGNLHGTTVFGGNGNPQQCQYGCGTVFKVTLQGELTILHNFCNGASNCTDGSEPWGGLIEATDGNFYGVTAVGGAHGSGTIFKITPRGKLTTLYSFCAQAGCPDGANPSAALMQDTDGKLYGTTSSGGDPMCGGCGTVFSLSLGLRPFVETLPTSGEVGTRVSIVGTNLIDTTSVKFNGIHAKFEVVSKSQLRTWVPPGATTGRVEVRTSRGVLVSNVDFRVTSAVATSDNWR